MSVIRKILPGVLLVPVLGLGGSWLAEPASAASAGVSELIQDLAHPNYAHRFGAALRLVGSEAAEIDRLLSQATSPGAEFVRLKRSGKKRRLRPPPDDGGVNVLLLSVDTLRADHLSCYGYERPTSPAIDQLARGGALFESAWSPSSWTLPAHMSLLTGLYPSFHKLEKAGIIGNIRLSDSVPMLTELLQAAGYTTAGFSAHGYMSAEWGFDRGFDFYGSYVTDARRQSDRLLLWLEWHAFHVSRGLVPPSFFLFAHYLDPHGKSKSRRFMNDVRPGDPGYRIAFYDSAIHFADAQLKRVFDALQDAGWAESTLVILVSDHGEELGEHGSFGHKSTLYRESLRVPLVIRYPRVIEADQTVEAPASLLDILPTVLDLVGLEPPAGLQGTSLWPYIRQKGRPSKNPAGNGRPLFAELHPVKFDAGYDFFSKSIQVGQHKLIRSYFKDGRVKSELYDLSKDPGEKLNLYDARKDEREVRELEASLVAFILEGASYRPGAESENEFNIDDRTQEQLRAQGYID